MAVITAITLVVYVLRLPFFLLPANQDLVREYFMTNFSINVLIDIVVITAYLALAWWLMRMAGIYDIVDRLLVVVSTTVILSGLFCLVFLRLPASKSFYTRWFRQVGTKALVYDAILVSVTFLLFMSISSQTQS